MFTGSSGSGNGLDSSNWGSIITSWKGVVFVTSRGKVSDGAWSAVELVQFTLQVSLHGVGLLVSDPPLLVLVEVVPGVLEVCIHVGWNLSWLHLVGSFEDSSASKLGITLHEKFLTGLVARGSSTLLRESGENVVHDLILISAVVAREVLFFPGLNSINILSIWIGVVREFHSFDCTKKSSND